MENIHFLILDCLQTVAFFTVFPITKQLVYTRIQLYVVVIKFENMSR